MPISLNHDASHISAGGAGTSAELVLKNADGVDRVRLNAAGGSAWLGGNGEEGDLLLFDAGGDNKTAAKATIWLVGKEGGIAAGGAGTEGRLELRAANGSRQIHFGAGASAWFGGNGADADVYLFGSRGDNTTPAKSTVRLLARTGSVIAGGAGISGNVTVRAADGAHRVRLDGAGGSAWLGGNGADGDLVVFAAGGDNEKPERATLKLQGSSGAVVAGGNGADGQLELQASNGTGRIRLDAGGANVWVGGNGEEGDLMVFAAAGDNRTPGQAMIRLRGDTGDIILANADCAEDFEIEDAAAIEPGTVVEIADQSRLRVAQVSYSRRVAGIVAGAGSLRPGIVLGRTGAPGQLPVALMGRAYCKVDATRAAIEVGDLLTTSSSPGHAMKATDPARSFGAIIGKALGTLRDGTGLLPVLVALQ